DELRPARDDVAAHPAAHVPDPDDPGAHQVISAPPQASKTRTMSVQSAPAAHVACPSSHSSPVAAPSTIGTPWERPSSSARRPSLSIRSSGKPWLKFRVSPCLGNLSVTAVFEPLETASTSSSVLGSRPARTPTTSASAVIAIEHADRMLLRTFAAWPW